MNDHNLRLSRRHDSGAFSQNKGSVSINGSNVNILLLNNLVQNTSVSGRWGGDFSKLEMLNDTISRRTETLEFASSWMKTLIIITLNNTDKKILRPEDVIDSDVHSL
jgi:hypothetical protein